MKNLLHLPTRSALPVLSMLPLMMFTALGSLVQAAPAVTGMTINMPDDGWYQVQSSSDYSKICAGVRSCEVPAGSYIVVNHTTGERFEDVIVNENTADSGSEPTVSGNTISWPDNGWYQVQDANTYAHVCEGGRSCSVSPGSYIVINHATGVRWENVEVAEGASMEADLSVANAEQVVAGVIAVINEEAMNAFVATKDEVLDAEALMLSSPGDQDPPYLLELVYGEGDYVDVEQYVAYACAAGGEAIVYSAGNSPSSDSDTVYADCVVGTNTYSGTIGARPAYRTATRHYPLFDFAITDENGDTRSLSGDRFSGNSSRFGISANSGWTAAQYLGPIEGGELQIDDYSMMRTNWDIGDIFPFNYREGLLPDGTPVKFLTYETTYMLEGEFTVSAPWSDNNALSVSVNLDFNDEVNLAFDRDTEAPIDYSGTDPREEYYWQSGSIGIVGADGSTLSITPVEGDRDSFLVTTDSGETVGPLLWADGYQINAEVVRREDLN